MTNYCSCCFVKCSTLFLILPTEITFIWHIEGFTHVHTGSRFWSVDWTQVCSGEAEWQGVYRKHLLALKMQLFPAYNVAAEITEQLFPGREVWNSVSKWNYSLRKRFLWGRTECNYPSWTSARTVMFKTLPALVESATGPFNDWKGMGFWNLFFNFFLFEYLIQKAG